MFVYVSRYLLKVLALLGVVASFLYPMKIVIVR